MPEPLILTQFSTLDALLAGEYASGMPVGDALAAGGFGVGCAERLAGEVVMLDGVAWECTVDDGVLRMPTDAVLPFADVCPPPGGAGEPVEAHDLAALTAAVEAGLTSRNLFHAVRVDGVFGRVRVRVTRPQPLPPPPLAEAAAHQVETDHRGIRGTLVAFWAPAIYQGVAVAGLHAHVLSDDRTVGGHVLEADDVRGVLRLQAFDRFLLRLPTDPDFLRNELTPDLARQVGEVEGEKQ